MIDLRQGDCLQVMKTIPSESIDAIVTDPPYGLGFMGKGWDSCVPGVEVWQEAWRILKPGAHMLVFAGTRTQHHMAMTIGAACFEIRDMLAWVYGSGMPKNPNIVGKPGLGPALKPGFEPITLARKPLKGTISGNVGKYGTGALNIDACRVPSSEAPIKRMHGSTQNRATYSPGRHGNVVSYESHPQGRWPANLIHDGSEEATSFFKKDAKRFFYCAKASKAERDHGLDGFDTRGKVYNGKQSLPGTLLPGSVEAKFSTTSKNTHPTVKPVALMKYLVELITPVGGVVLDPFMGSGSTGIAAELLGRDFIGVELDPNYWDIARARIAAF